MKVEGNWASGKFWRKFWLSFWRRDSRSKVVEAVLVFFFKEEIQRHEGFQSLRLTNHELSLNIKQKSSSGTIDMIFFFNTNDFTSGIYWHNWKPSCWCLWSPERGTDCIRLLALILFRMASSKCCKIASSWRLRRHENWEMPWVSVQYQQLGKDKRWIGKNLRCWQFC